MAPSQSTFVPDVDTDADHESESIDSSDNDSSSSHDDAAADANSSPHSFRPKRVSFAPNTDITTDTSTFTIPSSLQKLSALSASLVRSADAPREQQNSVIVAQAQALVSGGNAVTYAGVSPNGAGNGGAHDIGSLQKRQRLNEGMMHKAGSKGGKASSNGKPINPLPKELRWRTSQKEFPDEQPWVQPIANYATEGQARALTKKYAAAAVKAPEVGEDTGNAGAASGAHLQQQSVSRQMAGSKGFVPMMAAPVLPTGAGQYPQPSNQGVIGPSTHSNARPAGLPSGRPTTTPRYHILPDGKIILLDPLPLRSAAEDIVSSEDEEDENDDIDPTTGKKRKFSQFIKKHQVSFPDAQVWVQSRPPQRGRRAVIGPLNGGPSADTAANTSEQEALARNAAEVQARAAAAAREAYVARVTGQEVQRVSVASKEKAKDTEQQEPDPPLDYQRNQDEIAALIAKKRAENAASGQMQRLVQLRNSRQGDRARGAGVDPGGGVSGGGSSGTRAASWASAGAGGPATQLTRARKRPLPLFGSQAAAAAAAEKRRQVALKARAAGAGMAASADGSMDGTVSDEDEDEDAPGEDDEATTPATGVLAATPTDQSEGQDQASTEQAYAAQNAVMPYPHHHLITDPGDLESLFSSRDASPPRAMQHHHYSSRRDEAIEEPMSPSAQLLMALANAATPPPVMQQGRAQQLQMRDWGSLRSRR